MEGLKEGKGMMAGMNEAEGLSFLDLCQQASECAIDHSTSSAALSYCCYTVVVKLSVLSRHDRTEKMGNFKKV